MENQRFHKYHLEFGGLLEHLRTNGFRIGIDSHLRLHKVLNEVSGNCSPEDLRTLLAPIFATNRKQQEFFYSAFDSYLGLVESVEADTVKFRSKAISKSDKDPIWTHRWPYLLIGLLTTILIGTFLYRHKQQTQIGIQQSFQTALTLQTHTSVNNEPVPELIYAIRGAGLLAPMIFLGLFEFYLFKRRSLILRRLRSNHQPYVFSLYPPGPLPALFDSIQFHNSTRLLRGRREIEFTQLDIRSTIHATIKSLGYPQFRYRRASKIPEYLLLIERTTYDDHVTAFFDELANSLEEDGVFVARYYYSGDQRICFRPASSEGSASPVRNSKKKDTGEEGIPLSLVLSEHEESRLLILGACDGLFDPLLGTLQDWTTVFNNWKERAVITPIPAEQWTSRERILAQQFFIAPATSGGLHSFAEYFARTNIDAPSVATNKVAGMPQDFDAIDSVALKAYLGAEAFQWLCACAVYPRLEWVLTIYLGSVTNAVGVLDDNQLLRLIGLPWFRTGSMPQDLREELISNLNPKLYKKVQKAIINIFEQLEEFNRLEPESFRPMKVAVPGARKIFPRELLKKVLGITPRARVIRDYVFVRFLQSKPKALLDFLLPFGLTKLFYPSGNTALRSRIGARVLLAVFIAAVIWLAAPALARTIKTEPALTVASLQNPSPPSPSRVTSPLPSSTLGTSPSPGFSSPQSLITPNTAKPSPSLLSLTPTPFFSITSSPNISTSPMVLLTQPSPSPTLTPSASPTAICPEVKVVCSVYPNVQNKMSAVTYSATATTTGGKQLQESKYFWSLLYNGSPATLSQGRIVSGQGANKVELEWTIFPHTSPSLTAKVLVTGYNAACFTESACTVPVQQRNETNQEGSCDCMSCGGTICCPNPGNCISCGSCGYVCCSP